MSKIIWTKVDEAPALASYSLLPIITAFLKNVEVEVESKDISLASRIISTFSKYLKEEQKEENNLEFLGKLVKRSDANIIKLPNISASIGQLQACIVELQKKGYNLPDFPNEPKNDEERNIKAKYATCLGSAVNPVLREGNSDRRAANAVKNFAKKNPHKLKEFSKNSLAHVSHMSEGDFYENEQSVIKVGNSKVAIKLNGKLLKEIDAQDKEILDATFMSVSALKKFYKTEIENAFEQNTLFSLHLKATMMKVSDPILFGHCVEVFFEELFTKYAKEFKTIGINANLGLGDLYKKIELLPKETQENIQQDIENIYLQRPALAMVNSDKGITNLHASNDVIIDASLPVVIRDGGAMWNAEGQLQETKAIVPDRCYGTMYKEVMQNCVENGQFDVATMGNVSNVGLMAQKAEEYGSHPTTFELSEDGTVEVVQEDGTVLMSMNVQKGDIFRLSRTKDIPIQDWVKLAVSRASLTKLPAVFWLDNKRAHDVNIISKVNQYLKEHNTTTLEILVLSPQEAMAYTLKRVREGKNTISVTGNVLRDYLTDLFPILELGTSAKMLSVVPLIAGGGLFETGAGGSAPKHVEQLVNEGHLRWDSLGEFLALAESLRFIYQKNGSQDVEVMTKALDIANETYLDNANSPSRKAGEEDNKASHFYLATYWAEALALQTTNKELSEKFKPIASLLQENKTKILNEFLSIEGKKQDLGGYYKTDIIKASSIMRASNTLNGIIAQI